MHTKPSSTISVLFHDHYMNTVYITSAQTLTAMKFAVHRATHMTD